MRVTFTSAQLKDMIGGFNKVLPRNGSLPVLHYLLIEKRGEFDAVVTGTDLDETLQFTAIGAVQEADTGTQTFLVSFDDLKKLKLRKDDSVALEPSGDPDVAKVRISANLNGQTACSEADSMPVTEFPQTLEEIPVTACAIGSFLEAYRNALTFAATNENRRVLNGVFRHTEEQALVGTDGRRLGMCCIPGLPVEHDFIIPPSKLLSSKVLTADTGAIGLVDDDARQTLEVQSGPWRCQVRCVEGLYPNYRQVIPPETTPSMGTISFAESDIPLVKAAFEQFVEARDANRKIIVYGDTNCVVLLGCGRGDNGDFPYVRLVGSSCECEPDNPIVQSINGEFLIQCLTAGFQVCRMPVDHSPWRCTGTTDGLHVVMPLKMGDEEKAAIAEFVRDIILTPTEGENPVSTQPTATEPDGNGQSETEHAQPDAPNRGLTLVKSDPVQELMDSVSEAQEAVRAAHAALHGIKGKLRAVEKHFKTRQREFDSTRKVIEALKEAANF